MTNKIKVIDLLNKMASDVSYKPTFLFRGGVYKYNAETKYYEPSFMALYKIFMILNDEVEIIEEVEKPKKIEPLEFKYTNTYGNVSQHKASERDIIDKINEISKAVNYLLKKEEK